MADEKKPDLVQQGEDSLRKRATEILIDAGLLDPNATTNDDMIMKGMGEGLSQISKFARDLAQEEGLTQEEAAAAGVYEQAAKQIDPVKFSEEVLRRAEELRGAGPAMSRTGGGDAAKTQAQITDAARGSADVLERVNKAGGLLQYIKNDRPTTMHELIRHSCDVEKNPEIATLQRANDDMLMLAQLRGLHATKDREGGDPSDLGMPSVRDLGYYQKFMDGITQYRKAMDTTEDSAWTPTVYSYSMIENVYQSTAVARLFPRAPWVGVGSTMSIPAEGTDVTIYNSAEATTDDDDPKYTASTPGVGTTITATAKTITARTVWSYEMEEDSIINIMDHVRGKFTREFARGLDQAIIDGDTSSSHQDTGSGITTGDRRKAFSGLRYKGLNDATTLTSCASYWNWEQIMTPALLMGKYAQGMEGNPYAGPGSGGARLTDTVFICSHACRTRMGALRDTRNNNIWLTPRFAGDADVRNLGYRIVDMIGGYQIVPSAMVMDNLTTAGIYDGSTETQSTAFFVYAPAFRIYDKAIFNATVVDRPEQGQRVLAARMRLSFTHVYPSTDHTVGLLYYFVTTGFGTG
jgi:HK97 family phage major capsid protein